MTSSIGEIRIETSMTLGLALTQKRLQVPPNQRQYAWKEKHVSDLYSDLALAISQNAPEYFLGSIVAITDSRGRSSVVDGQQRLATSLILISAIRDLYSVLGDSEGAAILERKFILSDDFETRAPLPHLVLNDSDREYFKARVLLPKSDPKRSQVAKAKAESHKLIDKAAKVAAARVQDIVKPFKPDAQLEQLKRWLDYLEKSARVIWVEVPNESAAYKIFETMNDRGLALSAADLIKNYLFGQAGQDKLESVKSNWSRMNGTLEAVGEGDILKSYLRHWWMSQHGLIRINEVFDAIKNKYKNPLDVLQFSEDLANDALYYVAALTPYHTAWSSSAYRDIHKSIQTIKLLGVTQIRPLLLIASKRFKEKEVNNLFKYAVSWAVRLIVSGRKGGWDLEKLYVEAAGGISKGTFRTAKEVAAFMKKGVPADSEFEKAFADARVSNSEIARYYLHALQCQQDRKPNPYYTASDGVGITLEHILPENPNGKWAHIQPETFENYLTRIGNLALLTESDNSNLCRNEEYPVKKPILAGAGFSLTKIAGDYDDWGESEIEDRQKQLAKLAVKTWSLQF